MLHPFYLELNCFKKKSYFCQKKKMIKKIYLSIFSVAFSLTIQAQDYEKLKPFEKPKDAPEDFIQEYNRHSISFDIGGKDGIRYPGVSITKLTQLNSYVLGYRYMFNYRFGISPEIGWERFKDRNDSIGTAHYLRFSLNTYYNLTDLLRFNTFSSRLGMMAIAGAGYSIGFNPSGVVPVVDTVGYTLLGDEKIDKMIHGYFGARVMFKCSEKISIHSTLATVFNLRQDRTFDGQRKLGGAGFTGKYYNLTIGASYYLGKENQHADWYSARTNEKEKFLELTSELNALRKAMEDDDADGVMNGVDEEPNSVIGSTVNNKGVAILVTNSNGKDDSDADGFANDVDLCPNLAGSANGCPDADKDGVADFMDACPDVPGSLKFNGCKEGDFKGAGIGSGASSLLEENGVYDILFEFDRSDLLPSGKVILDRLATLMNENKSINVVVAGHTDKVGTKDYNETLSRKRAENCISYLVSKGVDSKRLMLEFFGSDMEKYPSDKREMNIANRRVTFKVK
ncbi:MAG: OmpA family protein [Flavobacteriales bacterium]|nr:OmpA family protein [Flavobacteriales bacterium]